MDLKRKEKRKKEKKSGIYSSTKDANLLPNHYYYRTVLQPHCFFVWHWNSSLWPHYIFLSTHHWTGQGWKQFGMTGVLSVPRYDWCALLWHPYSCMLVNHGLSQQSFKEEYKPWKWGAFTRYYASHTKTMLPMRTSVQGNWTTRRPDHSKEMQTAVLWTCFLFIMSSQNSLAKHSERGKKTRQTEEKVERQHQGMDRPGVHQVQEGSEEQRKMEETGCEIMCGVPTTITANG